MKTLQKVMRMMQNKMMNVLPAIMFALCLRVVRTEATTYCVRNTGATAADNNPGTVDRPFKTIAGGVAKVRPGDTVVIKPGEYGREIIAIKDMDGTTERKIVIRAERPGTVILQGNPTPGNENQGVALKLSHVRHVMIEGLSFKYYETGVSIADSEHITLRKCTFENNAASGVSNWKSHDTVVEECRFLDPNTPGTADNVAIQDYGVNFYHSDNCVVRNCYFFGKHNQACSWKQDCHGGLITGCVFEGVLYTGIYLGQNYQRNGRPPCSNLRAEHNIVRKAKGYRVKSPIRVGNCVNATIRFNYLEGFDETGNTGGVYVFDEARGEIVIDNNIFAYGVTCAVDLGSNHVQVEIFNNTFYDCPRAVAVNYTPRSVTTADNIAFKTLMTRLLAKDTSNYVGDPRFVGPLAQLPRTATPTPISYEKYWKSLTGKFALRAKSPAAGKGADIALEMSHAEKALRRLARAGSAGSVAVPATIFVTLGQIPSW